MIYKYLTLIVIFSFFLHPFPQYKIHYNEYVWAGVNGKQITIKVQNGYFKTPLTGELQIPSAIFDTLIARSESFEFQSGMGEDPKPDSIHYKGKLFIYCGGIASVFFKRRHEPTYCILIGDELNFSEQNCYRIFYSPSLGPHLIFYQTTEKSSNYYRVVRANINKQSVDKKLLQFLFENSINVRYWEVYKLKY